MTKKAEDKLRAEAFRCSKRISALRFQILHAGETPPRAGAPRAKLTKERKAEIQGRIEALEAERAEIRSRLGKEEPEEGASSPEGTTDSGVVADDFESGVAAS